MKKILHLLGDSPYAKILERFFKEVASDLAYHHFYQICETPDPVYPSLLGEAISLVDFDRTILKNYDSVFVNGVILPPNFFRDFEGRKVWFVWGFEAYTTSYFTNYILRGPCLLGSKTLGLLFSGLKLKTKGILGDIRRLKRRRAARASLAQFDVMACIYREEYQLISAQINLTKIRHWELPVVALDYLTEISAPIEEARSDYVLLGNSAAPENNHIEALDLLYKHRANLTKIICPLSYGRKDYAQKVVEYGYNLFGDQFIPIKKFLPKDTYNDLIRSCGTVVMNHRRQQALGNIWTALYQGAYIWMETTVVSDALSRQGIIFGNIVDFEAGLKLSSKQIASNRRILINVLGKEQVVANLRDKIIEDC